MTMPRRSTMLGLLLLCIGGINAYDHVWPYSAADTIAWQVGILCLLVTGATLIMRRASTAYWAGFAGLSVAANLGLDLQHAVPLGTKAAIIIMSILVLTHALAQRAAGELR